MRSDSDLRLLDGHDRAVSIDCFACTHTFFNTGTPRQAEGAWKGEGSSSAASLKTIEKNFTEARMNGNNVLYSRTGHAREERAKRSGPRDTRFCTQS
jgi:hypothetical protein